MKKETLASVIKERREKLGMSQRELSRKTRVDNNTIAKIEKGERKKPNILSLRKLSLILHINMEKLMELSGYSEVDIETTLSDSLFSSSLENVSIKTIKEKIAEKEEQIYVIMVLKELVNKCNIENIEVLSDINEPKRKKIIKAIEKYTQTADKEIERHRNSIKYLQEIILKDK